jgi:putative peptidoglycan lipid II flippase
MTPIRLMRSFATVGGWTMASRVLGLVRDLLMTRYLGAGAVSDAFFVAFSLPNMFRRFFAEGAFNAAFVPMFSKKLQADRQEAEDFARDAYWLMASVVIVFTAVAMLVMPGLVWAMAAGFAGGERFDLAVLYGRIAFPYIIFVTLVAITAGMLNATGRFWAAAAAPVLMNAVFIAALVGAHRLGWDAGLTLAWSVPVAGIAQLAATGWALRAAGFRLRFRRPRLTPELRHLFVVAAPVILAGGVVQVNLLVGRQVASFTDNAISWLSYADRLYQLPLGVIGIAVGVVLLPELSRRLRAGEETGAREALSRGAEFALALTLPAAVALVVIAVPIVAVLFERGAFTATDTQATALALAVYGAGLPAFVLHKVLQPLYFAREDTVRPFRYALWSMVVNAVVAVGLMPLIGFVAAALATTVAGWTMVAQLWWGTRGMGPGAEFDARLRDRLWRMVVAALAMGGVLLGLAGVLEGTLTGPARVAALAALVGGGMAAYFGIGTLIGAFRLADFRAALRRGAPRG